MSISRGSIKRGDDTLLENIVFHILQVKGNDSRLGSWSGYFTVPVGGGDGAWTLYNEDGPFTIVLEDGRTGQINFDISDGVSVGSVINFNGTGPLK